ncbi:MAG: C1 family peptidase [Acutalibacteraceae bacterium]
MPHFLENILKALEEPTDSRLISYLLSAPVQDGGQWDMLRNLVKKYGVVPKSAMPETAVSSNTGELDFYPTEKLRGFACRLRAEHKNGAPSDMLRARRGDSRPFRL